tara:strand:+ start:322 stop:441 length:120 start_codon:yes stop_codon:yes gene_type:complete
MNKVQSSLELLRIIATKFTEEANKLKIDLEKDKVKNQIS